MTRLMVAPFGSQSGRPWPTFCELANSFSSFPSFLWSRSFASSRRRRCSSRLGFFEESRPIDALEHLVVAVSAPVCPRKAQQLELLDFARRRNVNTAAQIEEFALLIDRYRLAFRNRIKQFQFQIIADFGKQGSGFLSADFFSYDRQIFPDDFFISFSIFGRSSGVSASSKSTS